MKIRITGASGSGKTYLGNKISHKIGITLSSMDEIEYDFSTTHQFLNKRPLQEKKELFEKILRKKSWILEGSYYTFTKKSYDQADLILYLQTPYMKRFFNVWKRFFQRIREHKHEGFRPFMSLLKYNFTTRNKWNPREVEFADKYKGKIYFFSSAEKAWQWFDNTY